MPGALQRAWSSVTGMVKAAAEGQYRPGPWYLPVTGGFLPANVGDKWNWWQCGYNVTPLTASSAIVEACVSAYAQTTAMCPGGHWRLNGKGGVDRVKTSALARILKEPNDYQTMSDFLLNATRNLYLTGNVYALCTRNDRFEIDELHLFDSAKSWPLIAEDGSIFYSLNGNYVVQQRLDPEFFSKVPARDVLHIKLHCQFARYYPLVGMSPLWAAALDVAANNAIKAQQLQFFVNQAKPGMVLSTDLLLKKDQVDALRDRWTQHTTGEGAGGTPILTGGVKPVAVPTISGRDAQLVEFLKLSDQDIALVFRIPMALLGLAGASRASAEVLMHEWIASGLGFCLNHIEEALGQVFSLRGQPDEYVEFDTSALLRSAFKDRIEGLTRGVQGGIYAPNEARNQEGLDKVPYGDEPRVQQQVVPLSAAQAIPTKPSFGKTPITASPAAPGAPGQPGAEPGSSTDARSIIIADAFLKRARRHDRRTELDGRG